MGLGPVFGLWDLGRFHLWDLGMQPVQMEEGEAKSYRLSTVLQMVLKIPHASLSPERFDNTGKV